MGNIEFVKYNTYRKDEFKLKTIIENNKGKRIVKKASTNLQCNSFIKTIANNYESLKNIYSDLNICNIKSKNESEIIFEYIEGTTLNEALVKCIDSNDKKGFIELIHKHKSLILNNGKIKLLKAENVTKEFIDIFGEYEGEIPFNYMPITNIDMIFDNIIFNKKAYHLIDYEWVFDFPIPVKYIFFRSVIYLYDRIGELLRIKNFISLVEIFELYDIDESEVSAFYKMEDCFLKYVKDKSYDSYGKFLKSNSELQDIISQNNENKAKILAYQNKIEELEYQHKMKLTELEEENKLKLEEIGTQLVSLIKSRDDYLKSYNDILNSRSWKTTKPLRFSVDKIRKLNNSFKEFLINFKNSTNKIN